MMRFAAAALLAVGALTCDTTPEQMAELAASVGRDAAARGFSASAGEASWFLGCSADDDDDPQCQGDDNPDGAYMQFVWPTREVMPDALCAVNDDTCFGNVTVAVPMGARDAVVFFGCTPPPSRYFSVDMVVGGRITSPDLDHFYPGCPFGDAVNTLSAPFGDSAGPSFAR